MGADSFISSKDLKQSPITIPGNDTNIIRLNNLIPMISDETLPDETILRFRVPFYRLSTEFPSPLLKEIADFLHLVRMHVFHSFGFLEIGRKNPCKTAIFPTEDFWEFAVFIPASSNTEAVTIRINQLLDIFIEIAELYSYEFGTIELAEEMWGEEWYMKLVQVVKAKFIKFNPITAFNLLSSESLSDLAVTTMDSTQLGEKEGLKCNK